MGALAYDLRVLGAPMSMPSNPPTDSAECCAGGTMAVVVGAVARGDLRRQAHAVLGRLLGLDGIRLMPQPGMVICGPCVERVGVSEVMTAAPTCGVQTPLIMLLTEVTCSVVLLFHVKIFFVQLSPSSSFLVKLWNVTRVMPCNMKQR